MQTATTTAQIKDAAEALKVKGKTIDLNSLRQLSGDDEEFIAEILRMFRQTSTQQVEEMKASLQKDAFDILGASAHRFKSSVSILGNSNLYELVTKIEHGAKYGDAKEDLYQKIEVLHYLVTLADEEIDNYLQ